MGEAVKSNLGEVGWTLGVGSVPRHHEKCAQLVRIRVHELRRVDR